MAFVLILRAVISSTLPAHVGNLPIGCCPPSVFLLSISEHYHREYADEFDLSFCVGSAVIPNGYTKPKLLERLVKILANFF